MNLRFFVLLFYLKDAIAVQGGQIWLDGKYGFEPMPGHQNTIPVDLRALRNNRGFGKEVGDANFDGQGSMLFT